MAEPGPSGVSSHKRRETNIKGSSNKLSDEELLHYLTNSSSDEEEVGDLDEYMPLNDNSSESDFSDDDLVDQGDIVQQTAIIPAVATTIFNWEDDSDMKVFPFTKNCRLLVPVPQNAQPIDFFELLADDAFFELIVAQTNYYATEVFLSGVEQRSRITQWKPVTVPELRIFFGLLFHMGTWKTNRLQDYWKTDSLFNLKCFSENMGRDRFLAILRCLHFVKNPEEGEQPTADRIFKIRPVLEHFNTKMFEIYQPDKNLSLDESMVLWRGRLMFRQYIQNKRHKYGVKLYLLTEPNGLVLNMSIYTGALDSEGGKGHTRNVVMNLMKNHLNNGHSLFMDNFYNSVDLAKELLLNKTYCTGTLRKNRKGNPPSVKDAKLKPGESKAQYLNGVVVGNWKDKREVLYISTEFKNELQECRNRRGQAKIKPLPIIKYNENMSGIDRQDQMLAYYPCERKTLRWYKKIGIHILQQMLLNSFFLYNKYSGQRINLYNFRLQVIKQLLNQEERRETENRKRKVATHIPTKIQAKNAKGETKRKKCRYCTTKKIRKDTIYECQICPDRPGLCLERCFAAHHENL